MGACPHALVTWPSPRWTVDSGTLAASASDTNAIASPPEVGSIVAGRYKLERVIGQGGMGVVYAAYHEQLHQRVAIKFLLPQVAAQHAGAVARFVREARACAKLRSEHVARVIDVGSFDDGTPYMVMEHLTGTDLGQVLKSFGALATDDAVDYILQACDALAEAHSLGIVHRDLKPSNLFVARNPDGTATVKLLDFGIAKAPEGEAWSEGALTGTDGAIGSPMYMSPEHLRSTATVDLRTDIWSLGIILHEILTTRHPFEATSPGGMCVMIAADPPAPLRRHRPDALPELEAVLLKCLEKDRDKRFGNVAELASALAPFGHLRSQALVERILRVTSSQVETRPSGKVQPLLVSIAPASDATQPSGNFVVHQSSSPPIARETPPPAPLPQRRAMWPLMIVLGLLVIGGVAFVARGPRLERGVQSKPAAQPSATSEPPAPAETPKEAVVPPPAMTESPPVAAAPIKTAQPKPIVKSPSKPSAAPEAAKTGAPSDPTETRK